MYSEEETELRDLIIQNLESCGFLNKIKAELRAGVCLALEEDGNMRNKIPLFNKKFDDFVATSGGKFLLCLVREFLEYFNLKFTLSVFDPETAVTSCFSRTELCQKLKLNSDIDGPILSELVKEKIDTDMNQNAISDSLQECQSLSNKSLKPTTVEIPLEKNIHEIQNDYDASNKNLIHDINNESIDSINKNSNTEIKQASSSTIMLSNADGKVLSNISSEKDINDMPMVNKVRDGIFQETKDILSSDHDPFFDLPLPSEKSSFFSFADTSKDKTDYKVTSSTLKETDQSKKISLSSLKDLPSLTTNNEWTFSRDPKNTLPSLESQKSISSSETSNEEIINLDSKENFIKKDSITESNEESSEKQTSDESIAEEIDDFSAGFDDILNNSLSLADDATTDQTISQVSLVEGVDHVETCK